MKLNRADSRIPSGSAARPRAPARFESSAGLVLLTLAAVSIGGCSFLVRYTDKDEVPVDADGGGSIVVDAGTHADGEIDATAEAAASLDAAIGVDTGPPDTGPPPFTCTGQADGTAFPGRTTRCCRGVETDITTNANCGACNIACNTAMGHSCVARDGNYYCAGCANTNGGGNTACWSGCCTKPFLSPDGVCVPESPCGLFVPICDDQTCSSKSPQTTCHTDTPTGSYCGY